MIALAMFYNHVIRYINSWLSQCSNIKKEVQILEKKQIKEGGIPNKIANISATKNSKRAEMCIK